MTVLRQRLWFVWWYLARYTPAYLRYWWHERRPRWLWVIACAVLVVAACSNNPRPNPKPPPPTTFQFSVTVRESTGPYLPGATMVIDDTARGTTNTYGYASAVLQRGAHQVRVEANGFAPAALGIDLSRHLHRDLRLTRLRPPLLPVRAEGRFFTTTAGTYRGRWTSGLSLLARSPAERAAFLDWAARTGFDGVRVFAGALTWANQTPDSARANLPALIQETIARGLYLYLVVVTDSATGYPVEAHMQQVSAIVAPYSHVILEGANELGHSTQSSLVNDIRGFEVVSARSMPNGHIWSLGAMLGLDEMGPDGTYPPDGAAPFNTAHLDRSRDQWNQVRRIREIAGISEGTGKPAISGEPIGAGEADDPGRRESDPAFFFAMGALCRLFELGACVFHSEDGLNARLPQPNQQACADAFLAGFRSIHAQTDARLAYRNAGWTGTDVPVQSFTNAVRVYSGITGNDGYTVVVGDSGVQVQWKNGYHIVAELGRMPGVIVWKIQR